MSKRLRETDSEEYGTEKRYRSFEGEIINLENPAFLKSLNKLIEIDRFPEVIHTTLKYYYTKVIKYLQLVNKYDIKVLELKSIEHTITYDINSINDNFNNINKSIILSNNKMDLSKRKIKLLQNKLYSDINNVKELSKHLLYLNINILNNINNKDYLKIIIEEHSKTNLNIIITNNNIEENSSQLRELENEYTKYLDDLKDYLVKFVDLKVEINSILYKFRDYLCKRKELNKYDNMVTESSTIQSIIKFQILKSIDNNNLKEELKEELENEYSNLYYFNNVNRNNGCQDCSNEKCKKMLKRINHFNKCKDSNCTECIKISNYSFIYNEYIKDK
jgi:hypothetical protein